MTAGVKILKTQAEEAYTRVLADRLPSFSGADWARSLRREAAQTFEATGLPHRRVEAWRWTDLRALVRDVPPVAEAAAEPVAPTSMNGVDAHRLVFVNGVFAPALSSANEAGLEVLRLEDALNSPRTGLAGRIGALSPLGEPVPLSLNAALMQDGAVIRVARDVALTKPIHLAFVFTGPAASVFARNLVVVEAGAKATVVESFEGPDDTAYHVNAVTEFFVEEGAALSHVRLQDEGSSALHLGTVLAEVAGNATFDTYTVAVGAAVSRQQFGFAFNGEETNARIGGVNLLKGTQHGDMALLVEHAAAHCTSRERFKYALDGESRGVFQGKIIVKPGAQKTDAKMNANTLYLAENVEFDGKPELEIFADDVQCGHGAAASELDDNHVFYLKARGIPQDEAEALLVRAFVEESLELVADESIRAALEVRADAWLAERRSGRG